MKVTRSRKMNPKLLPKPDKKHLVANGSSCRNPLWKAHKHTDDIAVTIVVKGEDYPICSACWTRICDHRIEEQYQWQNSLTPNERLESEYE